MLMHAMTQVPPASTTRSWLRLEPIDVVGDVEGVHGLHARAVGVPLEHRHHGAHALGERRRRPVALQLVVLDEVDARGRELADHLGELLAATARCSASRSCRSSHRSGRDMRRRVPSTPNAGPGYRSANAGGQVEVDELDRRQLLDLEEVAGHGRQQVGQRRAEVDEREAQPQAGAPAVRRGRRPIRAAADAPVSGSSSMVSTWAANRARTSSDSRATRTNVPVDCSPASTSAACSSGSEVSIIVRRDHVLGRRGGDGCRAASGAVAVSVIAITTPGGATPTSRPARGCPTRSRGSAGRGTRAHAAVRRPRRTAPPSSAVGRTTTSPSSATSRRPSTSVSTGASVDPAAQRHLLEAHALGQVGLSSA